MDDFPEPDGPTIAIDSPCIIFKFTPFNTSTVLFDGYENDALTNYMIGIFSLLNVGILEPD